jgi:hypothetical protein
MLLLASAARGSSAAGNSRYRYSHDNHDQSGYNQDNQIYRRLQIKITLTLTPVSMRLCVAATTRHTVRGRISN